MAVYPHLHKLHRYASPKFWRRLVNLWTLLLFAAIIWDFLHDNTLSGVLGPMAAIYTAALAIYSAEKEFERWYDFYNGRHPGEVYVIIWTALMIALFAVDILTAKPYKIPQEIVSTYIVVIGILAITKSSKRIHDEQKEREEKAGR